MPEIAETRSFHCSGDSLVVGCNFHTAVEPSPAGPGPALFSGGEGPFKRVVY
jgi:hypothetical protein